MPLCQQCYYSELTRKHTTASKPGLYSYSSVRVDTLRSRPSSRESMILPRTDPASCRCSSRSNPLGSFRKSWSCRSCTSQESTDWVRWSYLNTRSQPGRADKIPAPLGGCSTPPRNQSTLRHQHSSRIPRCKPTVLLRPNRSNIPRGKGSKRPNPPRRCSTRRGTRYNSRRSLIRSPLGRFPRGRRRGRRSPRSSSIPGYTKHTRMCHCREKARSPDRKT